MLVEGTYLYAYIHQIYIFPLDKEQEHEENGRTQNQHIRQYTQKIKLDGKMDRDERMTGKTRKT